MAKRQISETDLAAGMKAFGGFPSFGAPQPLRDNPFRDTRQAVTPPPAAKPVEAATPTPKAELVEKPLAKEVSKSVITLPVTYSEPVIEQKKIVTPKIDSDKKPVVKTTPSAPKIPDPVSSQNLRNEISYERVTLPMTVEMR